MTSALRRLADRYGIIAEYIDQTGKERRRTTDETRVALLAVMGVEGSTASAARRALEELDAHEARQIISPARVIEDGSRDAARFRAIVPGDGRGVVSWSLELTEENGDSHAAEGRARRADDGTIGLTLPAEPPQGYHTVRLTVDAGGDVRTATQSLIVVPPSCPRARDLLGGERAWGLIANLYAVRSARNWGIGDFSDLAALARWTARWGGAFVGVNPLHALRDRGDDISPYSPVSRVYRNVLYLDAEAVPELADSEEARALLSSAELAHEVEALRETTRVEYERVLELKRRVLRALHRAFATRHRDANGDARGEAYRRYVGREGVELTRFATFMALDEHLARERGTWGWRDWPEELRDPRSPAVDELRSRLADDVDFHRWVQFELDRQLERAASAAKEVGMPIGVYQDLAIGASPSGSDLWAFQDLFLQGASIGAPPDPYAADGQNWGFPPLDPRRLREERYRYWITLVRASLRHAGALRIDHVMGLFRQFWIPEGMSGKKGAYVRFPADDLLGILALESTRAGALVVGEDLGTVPPDVPPALRKWGILSSRVMYFEYDPRAGFASSSSYEREALATANTHDMATLAGFWAGRDVELRRELGMDTARESKQAQAVRATQREQLVDRLGSEALLPDTSADVSSGRLRAAVHAFLRRTPSWLVGLSLEDLVGETEPVNVPGVGPDRFKSWTRRVRMPIEALDDSAVVAALGYERMGADAVRRAREGPRPDGGTASSRIPPPPE